MGEFLPVPGGDAVPPCFGEFFAALFVVGDLSSCGGYAFLHDVVDVHLVPKSGRGLGG
ncbi:hypothetical protein [Streptomyces microflavus]|uniref:hypothetical protein n=1 Tax=Streptomyces microflavus TaxID=1919 RepID=UPI0033FD9DF9